MVSDLCTLDQSITKFSLSSINNITYKFGVGGGKAVCFVSRKDECSKMGLLLGYFLSFINSVCYIGTPYRCMSRYELLVLACRPNGKNSELVHV